VDLVTVDAQGDRYTFRDLYIDVIVPTDGRHYRMLDLDEYADAMADGTLFLEDAIDGLRRWQRFLDRYLHADRWPPAEWSDFPPKSIQSLFEVAAPFAEPVRWEG
jgi:predicted RNA-binding protein associated with RNAse of E/G family